MITMRIQCVCNGANGSAVRPRVATLPVPGRAIAYARCLAGQRAPPSRPLAGNRDTVGAALHQMFAVAGRERDLPRILAARPTRADIAALVPLAGLEPA